MMAVGATLSLTLAPGVGRAAPLVASKALTGANGVGHPLTLNLGSQCTGWKLLGDQVVTGSLKGPAFGVRLDTDDLDCPQIVVLTLTPDGAVQAQRGISGKFTTTGDGAPAPERLGNLGSLMAVFEASGEDVLVLSDPWEGAAKDIDGLFALWSGDWAAGNCTVEGNTSISAAGCSSGRAVLAEAYPSLVGLTGIGGLWEAGQGDPLVWYSAIRRELVDDVAVTRYQIEAIPAPGSKQVSTEPPSVLLTDSRFITGLASDPNADGLDSLWVASATGLRRCDSAWTSPAQLGSCTLAFDATGSALAEASLAYAQPQRSGLWTEASPIGDVLLGLADRNSLLRFNQNGQVWRIDGSVADSSTRRLGGAVMGLWADSDALVDVAAADFKTHTVFIWSSQYAQAGTPALVAKIDVGTGADKAIALGALPGLCPPPKDPVGWSPSAPSKWPALVLALEGKSTPYLLCPTEVIDADGDGSPLSADCDDDDKDVSPGQAETCDGKDQNCNGEIDEGVKHTFFEDSDGDGRGCTEGKPGCQTTDACTQPQGYVSMTGDCDDGDPAVNLGATEACNDVDDDCDTKTDEGLEAHYYPDKDGDGHGVSTGGPGSEILFPCTASPPAGVSLSNDDCDDTPGSGASIYPNAPEICDGIDQDCDGVKDEGVTTTYALDRDDDGYTSEDETVQACSPPSVLHHLPSDLADCDDGDACLGDAACLAYAATINPGVADEGIVDCPDGSPDPRCQHCSSQPPAGGPPGACYLCDNGIDENCRGPGNGDDSCSSTDIDFDGFTLATGDCEPLDAGSYPGAVELCDGIDNNCNGRIDEGFPDFDGDGIPNCQDTETCDGKDNDGDGRVDEGWDRDGDGFVRCDSETCEAGDEGCTADCDDADAAVRPGAPEICDAEDQDCDGEIDEGFDLDHDGYTLCGLDVAAYEEIHGVSVCEGDESPEASGCVIAPDLPDCDDSRPGLNPASPERCDGEDNDCDGLADEGLDDAAHDDLDGDGTLDCVDDDGDGALECTAEGQTGCDCDDRRAWVGPDLPEVCDGWDQDCDGLVDEGFDVDGDCHTTCGIPTALDQGWILPAGGACEGGAALLPGADCNDLDPARSPSASETCDREDDDCDGHVDEALLGIGGAPGPGDLDGDGTLDCVDDDGDGRLECVDGLAPPPVADGEDTPGDTAGEGTPEEASPGTPTPEPVFEPLGSPTPPPGAPDSAVACDCDDADPHAWAGAPEGSIDPAYPYLIGDGVDNDCDGVIDEGTDRGDDDHDGYCEGKSCAEGAVPGDCDDGDPDTFPHDGEPSEADGRDQDCDGRVDEGSSAYDDDGDGFCENRVACVPTDDEENPTPHPGDCDDSRGAVYPGAEEIGCDGIVQDCDHDIDGPDTDHNGRPDCIDGDHDGYLADGSNGLPADCNDDNGAVYPGAEDVCDDRDTQGDDRDNDCDGRSDEGEGQCYGCQTGPTGPGGPLGALVLAAVAVLGRRRRVGLALVALLALIPRPAAAQPCPAPVDDRSLQAALSSIDEAVLDLEYDKARGTALAAIETVPCLVDVADVRSIALLYYHLGRATWYRNQNEIQARESFRQALILDPTLDFSDDVHPKSSEQPQLKALFEDERAALVGSRGSAGAQPAKPPAPRTEVRAGRLHNHRVILDGREIPPAQRLYSGRHVLQTEDLSGRRCTIWLDVPYRTAGGAPVYVHVTSAGAGACPVVDRNDSSGALPWLQIAEGATLVFGVGALASGVALQLELGELAGLKEDTHQSCSAVGGLADECAAYQRHFIRSWTLIGLTAGAGVTTLVLHQRVDARVGLAAAPGAAMATLSGTF